MKTRTPYDSSDLKIKKNDYVLEVGSGPAPNYRSNVLVEKFIDSNYHRHDDAKMYAHQKFINASGEALPFKDDEFDYVICSHVLEHVDDPAKFIREQTRVAKRGYMEVPSFIGETLFPKESHKWAILEIDKKLVIYDKALMKNAFKPNFGGLFLNYLPFQSIALRLLYLTRGDIYSVRYEWKDDIDFLINPKDEYYSSFFTQKWTDDMIKKIFPPRSKMKELWAICKAVCYILNGKIKKQLIRRADPGLVKTSTDTK